MDGNIFKRTNLQQVCSFILYHDENPNFESHTYKDRLSNGTNSIYKRLKQICNNKEEYDSAVIDLLEALSAYEEVFTEVGMKSGARIVFQLLQDDCTDFDRIKHE